MSLSSAVTFPCCIKGERLDSEIRKEESEKEYEKCVKRYAMMKTIMGDTLDWRSVDIHSLLNFFWKETMVPLEWLAYWLSWFLAVIRVVKSRPDTLA